MLTGKIIPVTKENAKIPIETAKNNGLPEKISTEAQLWDEIFKKEVLEMPFLLLPLIQEVHGKSFPRETRITPIGTEFSVERVITKDISSIRSDISVWICSMIFHFECEIGSHPIITKRVFEYDGQAALVYADSKTGTKEVPYRLQFPYSTVLFLAPETAISDHLACELSLPVYKSDTDSDSDPGSDSSLDSDSDFDSNSDFNSDSGSSQDSDPCNSEITVRKSIRYAVPGIKVQNYSLQEIREKHLLILLPFTPIRFRTMLRKQKAQRTSATLSEANQPDKTNGLYIGEKNMEEKCAEENNYYGTAKLELTNFFQEIILILNEAVETGYICELDRKDILALLRKAMIRVFQEDALLLEVVNNMTAPVLELERETIVRLQKEIDILKSEKNVIQTENDVIRSEKNAIQYAFDALISENKEKDIAIEEKDAAIEERNATIQSQQAEIELLKSHAHPFRNWRNRLKSRKHM